MSLEQIRAGKYLSLVTTRRDGRDVATPVWFVERDNDLWVQTPAQTGKVKRIRHTPAVLIAPCTRRGAETGSRVPAIARVVDPTPFNVQAEINARYGLVARLLNGLVRLRKVPLVYLQLIPQVDLVS